MTAGWEPVIGLEVHVQLATAEKLFCRDLVEFGADPNRHVCPVCLGLPGALPVLNPVAVDLAVRAALALGADVQGRSVFARKHYFYPDLPKGYQISQFERPLALGGSLGHGDASVRLTRIHIEEDAGKSVHDRLDGRTAVDLNRAGTPLIEIVTEPDLRDPAEARRLLGDLKRTLEYAEVSDCNMEQGSLRVDANVSVRPVGDDRLGTKTEIKNLNSFSSLERALEAEITRQIETLTRGHPVRTVTLLWDDAEGRLITARDKEESHDYRYFPDPDLPIVTVDEARRARVQAELPELPTARRARFEAEYGVPAYDADVLTAARDDADYYEEVARAVGDGKLASNWVMGPLRAAAKGTGAGLRAVLPAELSALIGMVSDGSVSERAAKRALSEMAASGDPADVVVDRLGLVQVRDRDRVLAWVREVLDEHPGEVERVREGESKLVGYIVGQVMKRSGGAADPRLTRELVAAEIGAAPQR